MEAHPHHRDCAARRLDLDRLVACTRSVGMSSTCITSQAPPGPASHGEQGYCTVAGSTRVSPSEALVVEPKLRGCCQNRIQVRAAGRPAQSRTCALPAGDSTDALLAARAERTRATDQLTWSLQTGRETANTGPTPIDACLEEDEAKGQSSSASSPPWTFILLPSQASSVAVV